MDKCFPIDRIDISLQGDEVLTGKKSINSKGSSTFSVSRASSSLMLNYQRGDGIPAMSEWIKKHVTKLHRRDEKEFNSCVTVGSTDAFAKTLVLLNGDACLFDQYAYGTAVAACENIGKKAIGVATDEDGMIPSSLRDTCLKARKTGHNVDVVYLVPVAQNPTGTTMPESRKREIYKVCQELDLVIVEDDAYYYLHYGEGSHEGDPYDPLCMPGIKGLPRSFFSMDIDGRVLRVDSLSKWIGIRIMF